MIYLDMETCMAQPLENIKILDLTRALSGPFSTMILADLGAQVCKVEPSPGGDMVRQWGPFQEDTSVYYLSANRNKRSVGVNFRDPQGLELIKQLILEADVVVENFKVGTMEKMGLGYESLAQLKPGLIMASISGFGSQGPARDWPGFDQIAQGYAGFMSLTGTTESGPMRVGTAVGDLTSGMWLVIGVLSALMERERTGKGQHVETSLLASLMGLLSVQGQRYLSLQDVPEPCGNVHPVIAPYGTFETADGPLNLAPATQEMWERLCHLLGCPELIGDPRFLRNAERMQHRHILKQELEQRLRTRTRMEWTPLMLDKGIPAGPINNLADVFSDPQVQANRLVQTAKHARLGEIAQVALPISFNQDNHCFHSAPPDFAQHTTQVLHEAGFSQEQIDAWIEQGVITQSGA